MNIKQELGKYIDRKSTLLAVGPMSKNCVDATIEMSDKHNVPIMMIASRRQIDSSAFGGGYVENWDTASYSKYVRSRSKKKKIILCRDHGGPYQNNFDFNNKCSFSQAMHNAKESIACDIDNNFKIIHLDPSIASNQNKNLSQKEILDSLFELMVFCKQYAKKRKKNFLIEVGTEEQTGKTANFEEMEIFLKKINLFCEKNNTDKPTFVVIQTGTKVLEKENVGSFECPVRIKNEIPPEIQIFKALELCSKYGVWMKEHNADYLSEQSLAWHPKIGIHAVNVAPEFGVEETKNFIKILKKYNFRKELNIFLELSYKSKKWEKWLKETTKASDLEKSIIAGHYIFSSKEFLELKNRISHNLLKKNFNVDSFLKEKIKSKIFSYLKNFRLI
jgi:hypothetical protein